MRIAHLYTRLFVVVVGMGLNPTWADEVSMPTAATATDSVPVSTPNRGVTMNKVEAEYGSPTERHSAVGSPPITRWDYPGFSVFFERDHVIHSVVR